MKMIYTGAMNNSSGELAILPSVPMNSLLYGASGPASVDQLFNIAPHITRLSTEPHEVKYKHGTEVPSFIVSNNGALLTGVPGTNVTTESTGHWAFAAQRWMGFAWRGVTANSAIRFEMVKNIEWRPEPVSGMSITPPVRTAVIPPYLEAERELDMMDEHWTSKLMMAGYKYGGLLKLAASLGSLALAGPSYPEYR
jgi:hypothetical protein